jgi:acyl-CoA hydrolase
MTSLAYLTFVAIDQERRHIPIPRLILDAEDDIRRAAEGEARRVERLKARKALEGRPEQKADA